MRKVIYDFRYIWSGTYNEDNIIMELARIIIDNKAAILMRKCNKDTAGNRHITSRYHYVQEGTALQEHKIVDQFILAIYWLILGSQVL